jgi:hypothetical protein
MSINRASAADGIKRVHFSEAFDRLSSKKEEQDDDELSFSSFVDEDKDKENESLIRLLPDALGVYGLQQSQAPRIIRDGILEIHEFKKFLRGLNSVRFSVHYYLAYSILAVFAITSISLIVVYASSLTILLLLISTLILSISSVFIDRILEAKERKQLLEFLAHYTELFKHKHLRFFCEEIGMDSDIVSQGNWNLIGSSRICIAFSESK